MKGRVVPETAQRADWPRLVAQSHKDHENRIAALEGPASIVLTPATLPASGSAGEIRCDIADGKVKAWGGGAWNALW